MRMRERKRQPALIASLRAFAFCVCSVVTRGSLQPCRGAQTDVGRCLDAGRLQRNISCLRVCFCLFFFFRSVSIRTYVAKTHTRTKTESPETLTIAPVSLTPHTLRQKEKKTKRPHSLGRKTRRATFLADFLIPCIPDNPSSFAHAPPAA